MGCLRGIVVRVLSLVVVAVLVAVGYLYRHDIMDLWRGLRGGPAGAWTAPAPDAKRARGAFERLAARGGPAYEDLDAADIGALVDEALSRSGRRAIDSVRVELGENVVRIRGSLDLSGVPRSVLGPLASMLGEREPAMIGGPLSVDSAGRILFTVTTMRLRDFPFPAPTIPRILAAARVPGLSGGAVVLPMAVRVGDVRVSPAHVRVYRRSPR